MEKAYGKPSGYRQGESSYIQSDEADINMARHVDFLTSISKDDLQKKVWHKNIKS